MAEDICDLESLLAEIESNRVVVFSKEDDICCGVVKEIFEDVYPGYTCIDLDKRDDGKMIQFILTDFSKGQIVPFVFIDGVYVGGAKKTFDLYKEKILHLVLKK